MDNLTTKVTLLSVGKPYRIVNESTAEVTEGCTVQYLLSDGFPNKPVNDVMTGVLGVAPAKASMPVTFYSDAAECGVPCVCDCSFTMRVANGKPTLVPASIILPNLKQSEILAISDDSAEDEAGAAKKSSTTRGSKA